jgi:hypothetical protein
MRLYLDDDSASLLLARLLRQAGHDVQVPGGAGKLMAAGVPIAGQFTILNQWR